MQGSRRRKIVNCLCAGAVTTRVVFFSACVREWGEMANGHMLVVRNRPAGVGVVLNPHT